MSQPKIKKPNLNANEVGVGTPLKKRIRFGPGAFCSSLQPAPTRVVRHGGIVEENNLYFVARHWLCLNSSGQVGACDKHCETGENHTDGFGHKKIKDKRA
ncbi:MAG: hypothetical protein EPO07_10940 [Verrucomicrobia bacterium]|nr:MAG: hypothetical protein EPO07_10940 [Verrucomicrobiota bacterium]